MTKKKKIWLTIMLIAVLVIGGSSYFYFSYKFSTVEERASWLVKKLASRLDLSEGQKAKVDKIKNEILIERAKYKDDRKEIINELILQMKADKVDQDKLNKLFNNKLNKIRDSKPFIVNKLTEFHTILTPEQRLKLVNNLERFRDYNRYYR